MAKAKSRKKTNIFISSAVVIVLSALLVFVVAIPQINEIKNLRQQVAENQSNLKALTDRVQNYQSALSELDQVKDGIDEVTRMFPEKEQMVILVEGIESAVNQAGLSASLDIDDPDSEENTRDSGDAKPTDQAVAPGLIGLREVKYTLTVAGDYEQLSEFLVNLEHQPFITEVTEINIQAEQVQLEDQNVLENIGTATAQIDGVFFISKGDKNG